MISTFVRISLASIAAIPLLSGCRMLDSMPDFSISRPDAIVPQKFLHNTNDQLNEWLDQTCVVRIDEVPLSKVFAEPVFAPMNYRLTDLPADDPEISIDSIGMSRRQLLWAIAHEYTLDMTPVAGYGNNPSYIDISGRKVNE